MSFGFGVGDFLAVLELASELRRRFVDAPEQFTAISKDIKRLGAVLQDIEDFSDSRELTDKQKERLEQTSQSCKKLLEEIRQVLDTYQEVDNGNASVAVGIKGKTKRIWKRMKWDQERITEFRQRITTTFAAFDAFLNTISVNVSIDIKTSVDRLHKREDTREEKEERQKILDWLAPSQDAQHREALSKLHGGTGKWLFESQEFNSWLKNTSVLFCPGMPGAGKTTLAAAVTDHLITKFRGDESVGVAFFYCQYDMKDPKDDPVVVLASFLRQLSDSRRNIPEATKKLYEKERHRDATFQSVMSALQDIVQSYSKVFIVIDALDEFKTSGGYRRLVDELLKLSDRCKFNLLATSRHIREIENQFTDFGSVSLEIRAHEEDIRRYIDGRFKEFRGFVSKNKDLQEEIKKELVDIANGMFLIVRLSIKNITGKQSPAKIRSTLQQLRRGSDVYEEVYAQTIERIRNSDMGSREVAEKTLAWITCHNAERPLDIYFLQCALAIEITKDSPGFDEDNIPEVETILSDCAGLITLDEETKQVRFIHYTAQEYFAREWRHWYPYAHHGIALTCVTFLSYDKFEAGSLSDGSLSDGFSHAEALHAAKTQRFRHLSRSMNGITPFHLYAISLWPHHAQKAFTDGAMMPEDAFVAWHDGGLALVDQILKLLTTEPNFSAVLEGYFTTHYSFGHIGKRQREEPGMDVVMRGVDYYPSQAAKLLLGITALHFAAGVELEQVASALIDMGVSPHARGANGVTPLSLAASRGCVFLVKRLLGVPGIDVNSRSTYQRRAYTPLSWAVNFKHREVIQLLLAADGIDPNCVDHTGDTPLHNACGDDYAWAVEALLGSSKVDAFCKGRWGDTPLHIAATNTVLASATCRLLLAHKGADVNIRNLRGDTPLALALLPKFHFRPSDRAQWDSRQLEVVSMLLAQGADLSLLHDRGRLPISLAAKGSSIEVIRALVDAGADPKAKDGRGYTPLIHAAMSRRCGNEALSYFLGVEGMDLHSRFKNGLTALHLVAERREGPHLVERIERLLAAGLDVNAADKAGRTPLISLLTSVNQFASSSCNCCSATWDQIQKDITDAIRLMVSKGADVDRGDLAGLTPLHWTGKGNLFWACQALLSCGANIDSKDDAGMTPLMLAVSDGQYDVAELLLEAGANTTHVSKDGSNALMYAVKGWNRTSIPELLLRAKSTVDIDINQKNNAGMTALHFAATAVHSEMVRLLLDAGADIEADDVDGCSPLCIASMRGNIEATKLLIKAGAKVNHATKDGSTPLSFAAASGNGYLVKLLTIAAPNIIVDSLRGRSDGNTRLSIADNKGREEISQLHRNPYQR